MNINLIRFRGVISELKAIRFQLERIANALEIPRVEQSRPIVNGDPRDAEIGYTDPDMDYVLEMARANNVKIPGVYDPNEEPRE